MYYVTKDFRFEAAHYLPKHKGKCSNLHGHTYKLQVTLGSIDLNNDGMVVDFGELKNVVNSTIISILDHSCLNDVLEDPTAERLLGWIYDRILRINPFIGKKINSLKLWETPDSYAEYKYFEDL